MTQPTPRFAPGRLGARLALGLVAAGFVVMGLGWNGMAGNLNPAAQLPYLVSGGLMGIGLVALGAALMVTQGAREDRQRMEALLQQLVDQGHVTAGSQVPSNVDGLYAAGTSSFHRPGCRLVDGREEISYVTAQEAIARDLKPCRVCQPEAAQTNVTVR